MHCHLKRQIYIWIICDFTQTVHIMCAFAVTMSGTNNIKFIKSRIFVCSMRLCNKLM